MQRGTEMAIWGARPMMTSDSRVSLKMMAEIPSGAKARNLEEALIAAVTVLRHPNFSAPPKLLITESGAQHFPGGRFAGTNPPDALARHGSRRPAGARDREPRLLDRRKHKQRVARPRSSTTAPRVLPGHFEAGPPPLGRAY